MPLNKKESKIYQKTLQQFMKVDEPFEREIQDYVKSEASNVLSAEELNNVLNYLKVVFEGRSMLNYHSL